MKMKNLWPATLAGTIVMLMPFAFGQGVGPGLTPTGATQAGNGGDIPAWTGTIRAAPTDGPKFTITAANVAQYADKLSEGQKAMFQRYPTTWKMNVYPTHRSASLPPQIYANTAKNAVNARLVNNGNGIANVLPGVAFPQPKNGNEAIWNHLFRYRGENMSRLVGQAAPTANGKYTTVRIQEKGLWLYNRDNMLAKYLQLVTAPARLSGDKLLVYETVDQSAKPRDAWKYNKGLRKTIRAPNVAFDFPGTASDGQRTSDNLDMFNGSPERYTWTLSPRPIEMYVPYNSFNLDKKKAKDVLKAGHINPDHARYELHRVWKVDGRLKNGANHIYSRRTCYLDEDSWQIVHVDHYDKFGQLWRVAEGHTINYFQVPFIWDTLQTLYDLKNGRYLVYGLNEGRKDQFNIRMNEAAFAPAALKNAR